MIYASSVASGVNHITHRGRSLTRAARVENMLLLYTYELCYDIIYRVKKCENNSKSV